MSVKIAICDDDINMQFIVEGLVEKIMERHGLKAEIECFDCGDALCEAYEVGKFDLIFLDIEYKGRNGVQVAKYIRETKDDEYVQIAFVSGASGYAMELFDYRPINFLTKPVSEADVKRVIDKFVRLYSQKIEYFSYKKGSAENRYNLSDIIYFSSSARKITIHGKNGDEEFYSPLDDVFSKVSDKQFLYVHKSYIVNYRYIQKLSYEQVVLFDGTVIPISQSRRPLIRKQFMEMKEREEV